MRTLLALVLFVIAAALLLLAWMTLDNLWADYQDSPDATYITIAAVELGVALVLAAGGFLALRQR